jgi:hypothetical protein
MFVVKQQKHQMQRERERQGRRVQRGVERERYRTSWDGVCTPQQKTLASPLTLSCLPSTPPPFTS